MDPDWIDVTRGGTSMASLGGTPEDSEDDRDAYAEYSEIWCDLSLKAISLHKSSLEMLLPES